MSRPMERDPLLGPKTSSTLAPVFADVEAGPGTVERQLTVVRGQFLRGLLVPEQSQVPQEPSAGSRPLSACRT